MAGCCCRCRCSPITHFAAGNCILPAAKSMRRRFTALLPFWMLPLCPQVKLMSDTSILITPGGGIASVLNFLRPSATAIPMTVHNSLTNFSHSLDDYFYS